MCIHLREGFNREGSVEARGIIPRAIEQIFGTWYESESHISSILHTCNISISFMLYHYNALIVIYLPAYLPGHIQRYASPRMRFLVRASYLQIYNEAISDLLKPERSNLTIREDKKRGVYVDGLSEWVVRSPAEIYGLMERGNPDSVLHTFWYFFFKPVFLLILYSYHTNIMLLLHSYMLYTTPTPPTILTSQQVELWGPQERPRWMKCPRDLMLCSLSLQSSLKLYM